MFSKIFSNLVPNEKEEINDKMDYLDRPLRGKDFCSDMGEMSEDVLEVP